MSDNSKIFDRALLQKRRTRASKNWGNYNFLKQEAAERLAECLDDTTRSFSLGLELGCHQGELAKVIGNRVKTLIQCDLSEQMIKKTSGLRSVCDEEFLPFTENMFDIVVSALSLHHVNDLPGTLIQAKNCLKPDGLFLAIIPGANTFRELRASIIGASTQHGFDLFPRLSPLIEVRDGGALLQRAGFALPVVDSDSLCIEYENPFKLLQDLRGMGESNILLQQSKGLSSGKHWGSIMEYYQSHFPHPGGGVAVTVEFVTLSGWKPHESQQKPALRGSGKVNLKQIL
jgi:NADH dehydrogenase [ubiquinone] 1 alpha subcomplex assembly factor 5